jgi:hypothetical protein
MQVFYKRKTPIFYQTDKAVRITAVVIGDKLSLSCAFLSWTYQIVSCFSPAGIDIDHFCKQWFEAFTVYTKQVSEL